MALVQEVLDRARSALRSEPRIDVQRTSIALAFDGERMTVEGEVDDIAAKKLALERIAALPEVAGIVDRLRVRPAQPMGDREIRNHLRDAILGDLTFADTAIRELDGSVLKTVQAPPNCRGEIIIEVKDGIVTLAGNVLGLVQKRLAGVLAWWVPGSRDVINGLAVEPPESDTEGEIADAVRIALEKNPFVDDAQIRIHVRGARVTLTGLVTTESAREMAESDAWYVFGVDRVDNHIGVRP